MCLKRKEKSKAGKGVYGVFQRLSIKDFVCNIIRDKSPEMYASTKAIASINMLVRPKDTKETKTLLTSLRQGFRKFYGNITYNQEKAHANI